MIKRRILSAFCAAAILSAAVLLPGCSGQQSGESAASGGTSNQAEKTSSAQPKEAATLTWWLIGNGDPANKESVLQKINDYTTSKINAKLNIKVGSYGDYGDKIKQVINSGEDFDIMFTNNTAYINQVEMGAFADITDLVKEKTPDLYKFIPQKVWEGAMIKGKIYAVPTYKDSAVTQFWAFDDKYVKKYNIDVPHTNTFESLDKVVTKVKAGEGKNFYPLDLVQDGWAGITNDYDDLCLGLKPIGVRLDDSNRKVVYTLEQPDIMEKLKYLHKWYQAGIINPDAPTKKEATKGHFLVNAQAFPGAEIGWAVNEGVSKYDMVQIAQPFYTNGAIQGSLNAISANSEHQEDAIRMLQLINTDHKLRDMLAYGEEGKDFQYVKPNVVKRLTDTWGLGSYAQGTFFDLSTLSDAPEDQWDQVKKQNEKAIAANTLGFTPDISNLATEVTNCYNTFEKYSHELLTGASDPEKVVPQLKKDLQSAGMDTIISEVQKQIDAQFKK